MSSSVIVTVEDVQNRYEGDLGTRFQEKYLMEKIADAQDLIDSRLPSVAGRLAGGSLTTRTYKRVVSDVVLRVLRNPEGFTSESEGGVSYSRSAVVSSGNLWLTAQDVADLTGRQSSSYGPGTVGVGVQAGWAG